MSTSRKTALFTFIWRCFSPEVGEGTRREQEIGLSLCCTFIEYFYYFCCFHLYK